MVVRPIPVRSISLRNFHLTQTHRASFVSELQEVAVRSSRLEASRPCSTTIGLLLTSTYAFRVIRQVAVDLSLVRSTS